VGNLQKATTITTMSVKIEAKENVSTLPPP